MKLVHLADLHLGFRQYDRLASSGVNQREVDVASTASRAIAQIIAEHPDVIVIGGDVFHQTRPSNPAIVHAFSLFRRLRDALPQCEIIMVAGNHDAPRTADAGCILQLFRTLRIHVAESAAETFRFGRIGLYVLAVPDVVGITRPTLTPSEAYFPHRVLLLHGDIAGVLRVRTAHEIQPMDLHAEAWSYVALGHYHVYREVAPGAFYSGSLDYVSSDPWGELREQRERGVAGKGFVVHDLATGNHRFVPVAPARPFVELESIDCHGAMARDVDQAIAAAVDAATTPIDDAVVRVVLRNCPRSLARELNPAALRDYRSRALHFQVDVRKPEATAVTLRVGAPTERRTATSVVREYFSECPIPADLERGELVTTAVSHMRDADDAAPFAAQLVEV